MLMITSFPAHRKFAEQARAERAKYLRRLLGLRPFAARHIARNCEVTA